MDVGESHVLAAQRIAGDTAAPTSHYDTDAIVHKAFFRFRKRTNLCHPSRQPGPHTRFNVVVIGILFVLACVHAGVCVAHSAAPH